MINWAACKSCTLEHAENTRHQKFTRVSKDIIPTLENAVKDAIKRIVAAQPSKGTTIK